MDHFLAVIFPWCNALRESRTIVAAMNPRRFEDDYTNIMMEVWFEEFDGSLLFNATLFDCEPHGRELWFRAMKGEYGPIEIISSPSEPIELELSTPRMLTHDR